MAERTPLIKPPETNQRRDIQFTAARTDWYISLSDVFDASS
jgi:hypothetical protein